MYSLRRDQVYQMSLHAITKCRSISYQKPCVQQSQAFLEFSIEGHRIISKQPILEGQNGKCLKIKNIFIKVFK